MSETKFDIIDSVHKKINGRKATDEELLTALYPPTHYKTCPIQDPILDLEKEFIGKDKK